MAIPHFIYLFLEGYWVSSLGVIINRAAINFSAQVFVVVVVF